MDYVEPQTWHMTNSQSQIVAFIVIFLVIWYIYKIKPKRDAEKASKKNKGIKVRVEMVEKEYTFTAHGKLGRSSTQTEVRVIAPNEDKAREKAMKELQSDYPIQWELEISP